MGEEETKVKEERVRAIALIYYSRPDIKKALYDFSQKREISPRYFEGFGKRPDSFQYESDITALVDKGATSFHCSEELWKDPLAISTEQSEGGLNEAREGWDLVLDIDCKYLEYSKKAAKALIKAIEFHGIKNVNVKFSGSKGFHIIVPWLAFPEEVYGQKTKEKFPEFPRLICEYLTEVARPILEKEIEEEDVKFTSKLDKGVRCEKCKKIADDVTKIVLQCPICKREESSEIVGKQIAKKCPDCRAEMREKDIRVFHRCNNCNINSITSKDMFRPAISLDIFKVLGVDVILVSSRHLFRMPYSVDYKEPICIKKGNKIEIIEIGKFVDYFFKNKEDLQIADTSNLGYETISLSLKNNKTRFNKIKNVIRHKISEDLFCIKLESGRKVKVTAGHSLFILKKGKIDVIKGNKIKKGDYVIGLKKLNLKNQSIKNLNLSEELSKESDDKKKNIFLHDFDSSIFKEVYDLLSKYEKHERKAYNWKAYNILPLDIYKLLIQKNNVSKDRFRYSKIKYCKHGGGSIGIPNEIKLDKPLMRLLGYYIAEGHCDSRGRVTLSFGAHEKGLIEDSIRILMDLGLNPRIEKPHKTATQIVTQSTTLKLIFESLFKCGRNAKEKRVPSIIWNMNDELKIEFLNSYIKGDGHLEKRWSKIVISTVSKKLEEDLCFLLTSLGLGYSISERKITKYSKSGSLSYVVIIQGKEDLEKIGFKSFSKIKKNSLVNRFPIKELGLEPFILNSRWRNQYSQNKIIRRNHDFIKNLNSCKDILKLIEGDCTFLKVIEIKKIKPKNKYVYDLSIKDDENFVGGNCILLHNSLHEKTSLASVVIDKNYLDKFQIRDANPLKVMVKDFYPKAEKDEARELLIQAIDWTKTRESKNAPEKKEFNEIVIKDLTPNLYPPCVTLILEGIKQDGRKRALFVLINFFRALKISPEEMEKRIEEWNKKNYNPLKEGYIQSQLSWYSRQKTFLPPNCNRPHYKDMAVCKPDGLCRSVKNPVNYVIKKSLLLRKNENPGKENKKRKDFK